MPQLTGVSLKAQLLRGAFGSMGVKLLATGLGFLQAVVLARVLGPSAYGVYAFVLSLIALLAVPAQLGLPQVVLRETAKAEAAGSWDLMRGLWQWSTSYIGLFSLLMITAGATTLVIAPAWLQGDRSSALAIGLVLIPLGALAAVRSAALSGLKRVILGQLPESVIRPALMSVSILLIFFVIRSQLNAVTAMVLQVSATAIAFFVGAFLLLRICPQQVRDVAQPRFRRRYWHRAAIPLAFLSGLQLLNSQVDIIMLGFLRSNAEVGGYRVVTQIATLVVFGLAAINSAVQPHIASLYEKGDHERMQTLVTKSARAILSLAIPPAAAAIWWGDSLLACLFGDEYSRWHLALGVIVLGQLVNAGVGSVALLLNMTGHERDTVRGVALACVANICLNAALIPDFGAEGAAVATSVSLVIWNLVLWRLAKLRLGIESSFIGRRQPA
mgnify:CR=1 FL=1